MSEDDFNVWSDLFGVTDLDYDGDVDEIDDYMDEDLDDFDQKLIRSNTDDDDEFDDGYIPVANDYLNARENRTNLPSSDDTRKLHSSEARNLISNEHLKREDSEIHSVLEDVVVAFAIFFVGISLITLGVILIAIDNDLAAMDDALAFYITLIVIGLILGVLGLLTFRPFYKKYRKLKTLSKPNATKEEEHNETTTDTEQNSEDTIDK